MYIYNIILLSSAFVVEEHLLYLCIFVFSFCCLSFVYALFKKASGHLGGLVS